MRHTSFIASHEQIIELREWISEQYYLIGDTGSWSCGAWVESMEEWCALPRHHVPEECEEAHRVFRFSEHTFDASFRHTLSELSWAILQHDRSTCDSRNSDHTWIKNLYGYPLGCSVEYGIWRLGAEVFGWVTPTWVTVIRSNRLDAT